MIPSVRITGKPSPLQKDVVYCEVAPGQSLAQMLAGVRLEGIRVQLDGRPVQRSEFATTFPKPGQSILVTAYLAGEMSKDEAKTVGIIAGAAITIVAAVATWGVGSAIGGTVGSLVGALIGTAISIAGQLILGAVIQIKQPPKPPDARKYYGIEGSSNDRRPYGVVPVVLGQLRMVPPMLTEAYSEWLGHNYTRTTALFDFGPGNLTIDEVRLGDISIDNLATTATWIVGTNPAWGLGDVFTNTVNESNLSTIYSTSQDTDEIMVELAWTQTPYVIDQNGQVAQTYLGFNVYYRLHGSGNPFKTVNEDLTFANSSVTLAAGQYHVFSTSGFNSEGYPSLPGNPLGTTNAIIAKTPYEPLFVTVKFRPLVQGQYDVYLDYVGMFPLVSTGGTTYSNHDSQPVWTKLRSTEYTQVPATLPTTKAALVIRANQEVNGTLQVVSAYVQQLIPCWNGSAWVDGPTSNPAFIYRWLLTGCPATRRKVATSRVDDDMIKTWATFCAGKGLVFNDVVDQQSTLYDMLQRVAGAGRASFAMRDGKYSVALDTAQVSPVQVFSPRNSSGFSGARSFADPIHALKVKFPNQDAEYQTDERIVYQDGYNEDGSGGNVMADEAHIGELDLPGVTSPDAVWRLARYHLGVAKFRQNEYSFKAGIDNLVCQRGDRVKIVHDAMNWGAAWGRIIDLESIFTAHSSGVNDTLTPDPWDNMNSGNFTPPNLNTGYGMKFQILAASKLVAVRVWTPPYAGGFNGNTRVYLWGPGVQPIAMKNCPALPAGQVNTVWFDVPLDLAVGEYAIQWLWYSTIPSNVPHVSNLYAISYQHGPIFVEDDAAFENMQADNLNPIGTGSVATFRSIGYKGIDPVVVSDVNVVRNQDLLSTTPSNPILQQFELDEAPQGNLFGAESYVATIRTPKADVTDNLFNELFPHNAFLALHDFARGSATGSYVDKDGNLLFTTAGDQQRYTFDEAGLFSGLLFEPAATNSCLHSEDLDHASWTKTNVAVTPNQHTWPYKTGSADRITATEASGRHEVLCAGVTVSTFDTASASVFLHAGTAQYAKLSVKRRDGTLSLGSVVDLLNGTATNGALVESHADGWFRVGLVNGVHSGAGQAQLVISIMANATTESFVGNGHSIYATGAQLEIRSSGSSWHVTSYLPAGASPTTRAAESVALNLPLKYNRLGGLNPNRGTLVLEVDNRTTLTTAEVTYLPFGDPSTKGSIYSSGDLWRFGLHAAGKYVEAGNLVDGPYVTFGRVRVAISWWENALDDTALDIAISVNGSAVAVETLAATDRANLFDTADPDFFIRQLGQFNPPAVVLRKLHIYGDPTDADGALEALAVVGAVLPSEHSFWCGQEIPVFPIEGEVSHGDLVLVGSAEQQAHDLIVTKITPEADLNAQITCVDYNEDVYDHDSGTPPPFESAIEIPPFNLRPEAPVILNFVRFNTSSSSVTHQQVQYSCTFHVQPPQRPARIAKLKWKVSTGFYYVNASGDPVDYQTLDPDTEHPWPYGLSIGTEEFWDAPSGATRTSTNGQLLLGDTAAFLTGTDVESPRFDTSYLHPTNIGPVDRKAFFQIDCWYEAPDGTTGPFSSARCPLFGTSGTATTTDMEGNSVPNISDGQVAFDSFTLVSTVNGIQANWAIHNNSAYPNAFTYTIYRAPDVSGVAGTYAILQSIVGPNLSGSYLDPVTDGATYWYKVVAKVNFTALPAVESTPTSAAAYDPAGAGSTYVKNPNFDLGDIAWLKGTGWRIIPKP